MVTSSMSEQFKKISTISVRVKGMHCASCASIIERTVKKIDGVESIEVNPGTENAKISFDELKVNLEILNQKLEPLGYSLIFNETSPVRSREGSQRDSTSNGMNMSVSQRKEMSECLAQKKYWP